VNHIDTKKLLNICIGRLDKKIPLEEIEDFILSTQGEEVLHELEEELKKYSNREQKVNYWIILCNPLTWFEGSELYMVNSLLKNLNKEFWKINGRTVFPDIQVGDKGIIKVSEDRRKITDRRDKDGKIVDKLDAGIYATFEVSIDETTKNYKKVEENFWEEEESFVHIKVINNFFKNGDIIPKDESIELLTKNEFQTKSSKKLKDYAIKKLKEKIIDF
jgi:hypothetical protein